MWKRLEDQLDWYDRESMAAQRAYKRLKLAELVVATAVPVVAALKVPAALTAVLAAVVVIAEGPELSRSHPSLPWLRPTTKPH